MLMLPYRVMSCCAVSCHVVLCQDDGSRLLVGMFSMMLIFIIFVFIGCCIPRISIRLIIGGESIVLLVLTLPHGARCDVRMEAATRVSLSVDVRMLVLSVMP